MSTAAGRILMCPPDHYGIEYEINPWMSRSQQANRELASDQWRRLKDLLETAGVQIELMSPVAGLPDLVFTANAALIYGRRAVPARFRHPERQGEELHDAAWLSNAGYTIEPLPPGVYFEGAGDALFFGETLVAGYRMRSDVRGLQQLAGRLGCRVIPLELVDPYYYHLDTCFCPLSPTEAIYFPDAFDEYGRRALRELAPTLIAVARPAAERFACNAVVTGRTVITNSGCDELHEALRDAGYRPVATPLGEFVKAGGSAKCLTLRLDGEDAAAWRQTPHAAG